MGRPKLVRRPLRGLMASLMSGQGDGEADRFVVDFGEEDLVGDAELGHAFGHELKLGLGQPRVGPRVFLHTVVDLLATADVVLEVLGPESANGDGMTPGCPFREASPLGEDVVGVEEPPRVEVFRFLQAVRGEQVGVVGRVMVHSVSWRCVEAVDEQSARIVVGVVDGAEHGGAASGAEPIGCGVEQLGGDGRIVDGFEHAEAAPVLARLFHTQRVVTHQDASHGLAVPECEELGGVAVAIEGVLPGIEEFLDVVNQGRNPGGIVSIDLPREPDEGVEQTSGRDFLNSHGRVPADGRSRSGWRRVDYRDRDLRARYVQVGCAPHYTESRSVQLLVGGLQVQCAWCRRYETLREVGGNRYLRTGQNRDPGRKRSRSVVSVATS